MECDAQLPAPWPDQNSPVGIPVPVYFKELLIFEKIFLIFILCNLIGGNLFKVIRSN